MALTRLAAVARLDQNTENGARLSPFIARNAYPTFTPFGSVGAIRIRCATGRLHYLNTLVIFANYLEVPGDPCAKVGPLLEIIDTFGNTVIALFGNHVYPTSAIGVFLTSA